MAEGDVVVAKEVVECTIITNGKCIIDGGTILSSEIYAKKGLKADKVGSEASHPSKLVVGIDQIAKVKVDQCKKEITEHTANIDTMEQKLTSLKEESDRGNIELGQIAQIQDKHMVDRRKLTDLIENEKRDPTLEEQNAISILTQKMEEIDQSVAELMSQDEEIQTQIVKKRNDINELKEQISLLNEEVKDVELFASQDMGIPTVQISGKLYQGTEIVGPHDALVIDKNLYNASLKEQKNNDKEAGKPYFFKISQR
jgi:DNA repair exonuclease SbcCD ATPase subunit